jgi:hypothetical protein
MVMSIAKDLGLQKKTNIVILTLTLLIELSNPISKNKN